MQQAYRAIRVVAEAQTVRISLAADPHALMLRELAAACKAFGAESGSDVKAVILDIGALSGAEAARAEPITPEIAGQAVAALQAVAPPVLAVAHGALSAPSAALVQAADLALMADTATLTIPAPMPSAYETIMGREALQKGFVTWVVESSRLGAEQERVLDRLRDKSALALRLAKASLNLSTRVQQAVEAQGRMETSTARLAALQEVNDFYLEQVAQTADATEGLRAFLEKRPPQWKNR
jgi:enoyl-CoA hydratase/carnithine racemase